ncbi:glycoside hydrolase family 2 [Paenibacillus sp. MBLB2552]|uniref:Glycoside hydrolase family 2 n=1 Tax=Paenibacillus mellifer TaxID=2937794 RepID=A0A9X2BPY1_9BACL|nr:glycoside hydrolase family 2 TIM barrel-domain containing protein [Paenibacillus mellifer]MCK8488494.1 glycoside hydrolase family 2 [Paenibacillus mellifer]
MRHTLCLNGEWDFMPLYGEPRRRTLPESLVYEEQKVRIPSSWRHSYAQAAGKRFGEIPEHGFAPMDLYGYPKEWDDAEAGVLHRHFRVPEEMAGQRIVLRLDGIMQKAVIYLDRNEVAVWEDGYLPLRLDITSSVTPGREHELHLVCGSFDQTTLPSGAKKVTGLVGSWFGSVCRGIWQDVYLESYPALALEDVTLRTSVRNGRLEADAVIGGTEGKAAIAGDAPLRVRLRVCELGVLASSPDDGGPPRRTTGEGQQVLMAERAIEPVSSESARWQRLCENDHGGEVFRVSFDLDWADATWWSSDSPFLYRAEFELLDGERVIDRREETFGFREFWCEGPQFRLNWIPLNLRGDSWHFQGGTQQTEGYIRNWYRMCRSIGVNSIRLHAEPYPADYLRIADEEGMLIVDETAIYGSSKSMQADHPDFLEACRLHVRRLVRRDKNHPSVILWSVQNEMRWVDGRDGFKKHLPGLMASIREMDPTRAIIAEGDNRLLPKAHTEVESRHYNIDGTIEQWDRTVPLTFGEHGGWWYICPQNSSMYIGLRAYRGTDESTLGLAEKERLFVEYARRQRVSGLSTFNFAHYFMRAMPEREVLLPTPVDDELPGVKPKKIPAYSLTLHNGLLPEEEPRYRPNPAFAVMAETFKPVTIIAAEYDRCFYDDQPIDRSFDVYNDTLSSRNVMVKLTVKQGDTLVHEDSFEFTQSPAEPKVLRMSWQPLPVQSEEQAELTATLLHDGQPVHELRLNYRIFSASLRSRPVPVNRPVAYWGNDADYETIRRLVPGCERVDREQLADLCLPADGLLVIGSYAEDADGTLERLLQAYVARGGRLLLLEQNQLSLGKLTLSRRPFQRAHAGDYGHPAISWIGDDDLMFWQPELAEEGPRPIIRAAFEKPVRGDFTLLLECSAGDFGDGGDLWSPLLEYRHGRGRMVANQLELMGHADSVPQACLLLRNLLAYMGGAAGEQGEVAAALPTAALVRPGGPAAALLGRLRLRHAALADAAALALGGHGGGTAMPPGQGFGLLVAEACLLEAPGAAEAVRRHAEAGGRVLVLPAEPLQQAALARLLDRPVRVAPHETYHLAADYAHATARGLSPVDLFGFDKVFLSPREVVNRVLATHRLEAPGVDVLCTSVEDTAWKDFFVQGYTAEYSRLALVEINRQKAQPSGAFLMEAKVGSGTVVCSQLLPDPESDKAQRFYTRLLANLGASFDDELLSEEKGDGEWAVETMMALPCPPYVDYEAMRAYYTDREFSLNNLGEGLYGWMQKKERRSTGLLHIANAGEDPWFLSCFVTVPDEGAAPRRGRLRMLAGASTTVEIVLNGELVPEPEQELALNPGLNRLIAIVRGADEDIDFGLVFLHPDGRYMKDLSYSLTLNEVEPK